MNFRLLPLVSVFALAGLNFVCFAQKTKPQPVSSEVPSQLTGLSIDNTTVNSTILHWCDTGESAGYNVRYHQVGTGDWSTAQPNITALAISGLAAGKTYEFQVQSVADNGKTGQYSKTLQFSTLDSSYRNVPSSLNTIHVENSEASLSWDAVTAAANYNVRYKPFGSSQWQIVKTPDHSSHLSSLNSGEVYEWQVQSVDGQGVESRFSSIAHFTATGSSSCDSTLWFHIYNSTRLAVHQQCITVTGTGEYKTDEADGDVHVRINVDAPWAYMINASNVSGESGYLVVEPVCCHAITQADAVAACVGFSNSVYIPNSGERLSVTGAYVTDNSHGWNEIHPVTQISLIGHEGVKSPALAAADIRVYPNPANSQLNFSFDRKPGSIVYLSVVNSIGRLAGQYQMLETTELKMNTSFWPEGNYFYTIIQDGNVVKKGGVTISH